MAHDYIAGREPVLRALRLLCVVTGCYDIALGLGLIFFLPVIGDVLGVAKPHYPVNAHLNGVFVACVGAGYFFIVRRIPETLWYLWLMGVVLHLAGAVVILTAVLLPPPAPWQFSGFGIVDGALGVLFLIYLLRLTKQGR